MFIENGIIYEKTKNSTIALCNLNIIYNSNNYKFCMGDCALEECIGQYHLYISEIIQEEQQIEIGYDEELNPIYEMQMVDIEKYIFYLKLEIISVSRTIKLIY